VFKEKLAPSLRHQSTKYQEQKLKNKQLTTNY